MMNNVYTSWMHIYRKGIKCSDIDVRSEVKWNEMKTAWWSVSDGDLKMKR